MNRLLSKNILGMIFVKSLAMIISFSVIPLYLFYFDGDKSKLGQWLVLFSMLSILISFDFGVSSRLKNDLLSTNVGWGTEIVRAMIANFFISLSVVVILILFRFFDLIDFFSVIHTYDFYTILAFLTILSPFKVSISILQARQHNWLSAFIVVIPQIFILLYLLSFKFNFVCSTAQYTTLLYILCISTLLCYMICFSVLLNKFSIVLDKQAFFSPKFFTYALNSFSFFIAQVGLIVLITMNDVIYGLLGIEELVVDYQYYFRIYSLVFVSFSSITVPFWSAIRHQYVNGNYKSVRKLVKYLYILLAPVLISLVIIGFNLQYIFNFWLGAEAIVINEIVVICFSILSFSMCLMYVFTALLNSFNEIGFQAKTMLYAALVKCLLIFIGLYIDLAFDVVILSTVISMIIVALLLGYKAICFSKKLEV